MLGATTTININAKPWNQRQGDWEHSKVLSLIQCKKLKHIATKELLKLHFSHGIYHKKSGIKLLMNCKRSKNWKSFATKKCAKINRIV
jgi:hypothetical protein